MNEEIRAHIEEAFDAFATTSFPTVARNSARWRDLRRVFLAGMFVTGEWCGSRTLLHSTITQLIALDIGTRQQPSSLQ